MKTIVYDEVDCPPDLDGDGYLASVAPGYWARVSHQNPLFSNPLIRLKDDTQSEIPGPASTFSISQTRHNSPHVRWLMRDCVIGVCGNSVPEDDDLGICDDCVAKLKAV
jgi:hypothetical protein